MKFNSPSRFTSFYESFSDLIFATMAIFVLLMIIFLSLINPPESTKELVNKLNQSNEKLSELQSSLQQTEQEKRNLESQFENIVKKFVEQNNAVKSNAMELIIAVDVSGSMGKELALLASTINTILKVLPSAATEFRIALVAYAITGSSPGGLNIFPKEENRTKKILPEKRDNGSSITEVTSFTNNLIPQPGVAPVENAINKAIELSSSVKEFEGFQTIMLLGDIGPYEFADSQGGAAANINPSAEKRILQQISAWTSKSKKRNFISVFSGRSNAYPHDIEILKASEVFFQEAAKKGGGKENFTNNRDDMLTLLLTTVFKEN